MTPISPLFIGPRLETLSNRRSFGSLRAEAASVHPNPMTGFNVFFNSTAVHLLNVAGAMALSRRIKEASRSKAH
jgi:hypothetical protein